MTEDMRMIITNRIKRLKESRANNRLEGIEGDPQAFAALLERAKAPISDEKFVIQEKAAILEKYSQDYVTV